MLIYIIELVGIIRTYFNIPKLVPLIRIKELESLVIDAICCYVLRKQQKQVQIFVKISKN